MKFYIYDSSYLLSAHVWSINQDLHGTLIYSKGKSKIYTTNCNLVASIV